jgi:hypothetical protein
VILGAVILALVAVWFAWAQPPGRPSVSPSGDQSPPHDSPSGGASPTPVASPFLSTTDPILAACQQEAVEGVVLFQDGIELAFHKISSKEFDARLRRVYLPAAAKCTKYLADPATSSSQMAACDLTAHYASEATATFVGLAANRGSAKRVDQRAGFRAFLTAAGHWTDCFPGQPQPLDLSGRPYLQLSAAYPP